MKTFFALCVLLVQFKACIFQHVLYNCTSEDVKYRLYFLGLFPCSLDSNRDLNECDMLTMSAVQLAIDKINHDPNILYCFKLKLLPVFLGDPVQVRLYY